MNILKFRPGSSRVVRIGRVARCFLFVVWAVAAPNPCSAQTAVLRVGPHGTYPTIQGAIGGLVDTWVNEVRIERGTYVENVEISNTTVTFTSGEIHLSGGWDSAFTTQTPDPSLTTIDGNGVGRCLFLFLTPSAVTTVSISNMTLTGGRNESGGGLSFIAGGDVRLIVSDCRIIGNTAFTDTYGAAGGGIYANIGGFGNSLWIRESIIANNLSHSIDTDSDAIGGGVCVAIMGLSSVSVENVEFNNNQIQGERSLLGAGLFLNLWNDAVGWVADSTFVSNRALSVAQEVEGIGAFVNLRFGGLAELRRNRLFSNSGQAGAGSQFGLAGLDDSVVHAGDTVVADGPGGVLASASDTVELALTNLTCADNTGVGLTFILEHDTTTASLHNAVFFGNGTDLSLQPGSGTIAAGNNLVGVDPLFVDPSALDYRLAAGSPAENAGTNTPFADLGDADCDGGIRVIDGTVDIGAYEGVDLLFSGGFELRHTLRWSAVEGD